MNRLKQLRPDLSRSWQKAQNSGYQPLDGVEGQKSPQRLPLKFHGESFGAIKLFENEIFNIR